MNPAEPTIGQLIEEHYQVLFRYAWRLSGSGTDAEDLTQQTFLTAQSKLHQLENADAARAWLFRILRNHYLKILRKGSPASLEVVPEPHATDDEEPSDFDSATLQQALDALSEEYRLPVLLFYFEDLSYREIADQLQIPLGTVMSRLARGRDQLKQKLNALRASWETPG